MVVTKHFLAEKLGLDIEIAGFFADRKVPANNLYWHKRFLYLSFGTGFLFIPVIFDALYKAGVDKSTLIDPRRAELMETAFHIVALHETKQISFEEYITRISAVFANEAKHKVFFEELLQYFKTGKSSKFELGTPVPALNRADAFLFTFADLPVEESKIPELLKTWYNVAVTVLMLDDLVDLDDDRSKGEENAVLELGDDAAAVEKATEIINKHLTGLGSLNPTAENFFRKVLDNAIRDAQIQALINKTKK